MFNGQKYAPFIFSASIYFVLVILQTACTKSNENTGELIPGNITLDITVEQHTWGVPYTHVYVKKNTTIYPGEDTALYDLRKITDNDGKVSFEGLHPGKYFVFSKGYDMIWGDTVIGYSPVQIVSTALENNSLQLTLTVSE